MYVRTYFQIIWFLYVTKDACEFMSLNDVIHLEPLVLILDMYQPKQLIKKAKLAE